MLDAAVLIPALPLAGFVTLVAFGRRMGEPLAGWLATTAMGGSFLAAVVTWVGLLGEHGEARAHTQEQLFDWLPVLGVKVAILVDPLSITMALFVTGVGALIHLYAIGYMHGDPDFSKFFVYLNLFAFSMLTLVLADSYLLMFVGWEGVGACSYLLISFWFTRETAATAGKKAFVTNRVGDVGLMLAMFVLFTTTGSLTYSKVFEGAHDLTTMGATAVVLLLLLGAAGKSAQLPLYVWLPDAMEGPTPVSALIHAATMVTAGVYLMARSAHILELAPEAMTLVAIVGAATALFAATIACAQNDIKRVLAYSTISQLGYMFLAVGSGAFAASIFHMVTHAFFKALLFLGAGSVIHGMHHEQDMKKMGALQKLMPITAGTFIVGWLAIAGVPPFAGFWSKDEILAAAWEKSPALWFVGLVTAVLTAYYMSRQVFLVFFGQARWKDARPEGEHADDGAEDHGHAVEPHESPWTMWVPLVVLAALAVVAGALNLPFGERFEVLAHWLEPAVGLHHLEMEGSQLFTLAAITTVLCLGGIALARSWIAKPEQPALEPSILQHAWGVDATYATAVDGPGRILANSAAAADRQLIDGAVNGVAAGVASAGGALRKLQTGYVRNYALGLAFGTAALLGWVLIRAGG